MSTNACNQPFGYMLIEDQANREKKLFEYCSRSLTEAKRTMTNRTKRAPLAFGLPYSSRLPGMGKMYDRDQWRRARMNRKSARCDWVADQMQRRLSQLKLHGLHRKRVKNQAAEVLYHLSTIGTFYTALEHEIHYLPITAVNTIEKMMTNPIKMLPKFFLTNEMTRHHDGILN